MKEGLNIKQHKQNSLTKNINSCIVNNNYGC